MNNGDSLPIRAPTPTRQQILQAALICFANKGYYQTTMDDIVATSGLSKGSLYWHFKSKQELFIALVEWFFLRFSDEMAQAQVDDTTATAKIRAMIMVFVNDIEQLIPFFKLTLDFWARTSEDEQLRRIFEQMLTQFQGQLAVLIEEGIANGEFRAVNASQVALALTGMFDALGLYKTLLGEKIDLPGAVEAMFEVVLAGLRPAGG